MVTPFSDYVYNYLRQTFRMQAIDQFVAVNQTTTKGEFELLEGEWLMIWSSQVVCI